MKSHLPRIWRPFTIQHGADPAKRVIRGCGIWLELEGGQQVMDLISSWWVNLHGHAHPHIAQAIAKQAESLEHVIFAGYTHDPAEQFAERILEKTKGQFRHIFFSDNGSTAVEVALKITRQFWVNQGEIARKRFLAFDGAYHGDTLAAMSAGDRSVFTQVFDDWLLTFHRVAYPETWIGDTHAEVKERETLRQIESVLDAYPGEFAGVIIEPLIQGAGGMRMCRPEFLRKLQSLLKDRGILIIYDEVMTGFGRTGDFFAYQRAGTQPDLICLSKGITGGFLPMAVTLTTTEVFEPFYSADPMQALWHGHSYTGNPLGCAAANASLDLMEQASEVYMAMETWHLRGIKTLEQLDRISKPRVCGTVAALTIRTHVADGYLNTVAGHLKRMFLEHGMLIRPLGNVLYFMPPYCVGEEELHEVYLRTGDILKSLP